MRKLIYLIIFLVFSVNGLLAQCFNSLKALSGIDPASISYMIVDLKTGKTLEGHNIDKPLIPASIMKAVTIAGLTKVQKLDYRYPTKVYTTGKVEKGGVLRGNIEIVGSGDPSLNTRKWPESADFVKECVNEIKANGIKKIVGSIKIDNSLFSGPATPTSWGSGDLSQYYGTGVHAFNFRDNASGQSSVANPGKVFVDALKTSLKSNGIQVLDSIDYSQGKRIHIYTHNSPTLDEIMRSCMNRSDNMFAEAFLRKIALSKGKPGSVEAGVEAQREIWTKEGVDMSNVVLIDGSGLSRSNRVTANFMASLLRKMASDPYYVSFFPLAGQEGTLKSFLANTALDSYIAMKTGSMNGIQCYAGYKLDEDYAPTHVVVFIVNNMKAQRPALRKEIEKGLLCFFSKL